MIVGASTGRWLAGRLAFALLVLIVLSFLIFTITEVFSGDVVARIYRVPMPEYIKAAVRERLGLNEPAIVRYGHWLLGMLRLDMGVSIFSRQPIASLVGQALIHSLVLGALATLVILPLSVILGTVAALNRGGWVDRGVSLFALAGLSVPEFVLASLLVWLLAVVFPIFPSQYVATDTSLAGRAWSLVLPVLTLIPVTAAYMIRTMRTSMSTVLVEDYVEMGRIKGLSRRRVILRHALPNALIPMVNVFALNIGWLIGGIVVVEIMFQYPGLGRLLIDAIRSQDVPVIQAAALTIGVIVVVLNVIADLVVFALDPRVRRRGIA